MSARRLRRRRVGAAFTAIPLLLVLAFVAFTVLSGPADTAPGVENSASDATPAMPSAEANATATAPATTTPPPSPTAGPREPDTVESAPPAASGTALELLATLPVKGRAAKTGYDRTESFGSAWRDVDRNGCDTRNDILARDLSTIDRPNGCRVLSGQLADPYTGTTISFVRGNGTSQAVQIDHVVALLNAWQSGAQKLTPEQRVELANDPLNLLAVDGPSNSRKGAGDAATWLPPNKGFRCEYVARQVAVKARYELWVTQAEHDAIARVLASCPEQPATP